jgi:hypothetical protein
MHFFISLSSLLHTNHFFPYIIYLHTDHLFPYIKKTSWSQSESELYRPSDCHLSTKLVPTFVDRGCHVVSMTDPYSRILSILDQSHYFFFQVAPQLHSRGWHLVPDPLLLRKSGSARNRTQTSGSVARNSDHQTTEVVLVPLYGL